MKGNHRSLYLFLMIGCMMEVSLSAAQTSTYTQVYSIFQAKCLGCHSGASSSGLLDLSASQTVVYSSLVGKNPVNPAALARGDKRIDPGYQHRSYLLRKINNGLDADNGITTAEGATMPLPPNPALTKPEIELIRQWVLEGAPQNGTVVDTSIVNTYYRGKGYDGLTSPLAPPNPSQGFQIHVGKVFAAKNTEQEWFLKYNPRLASDTEIYKVELALVPETHHFVIYKYFTGQSTGFAEGLRDTSHSSHGSANLACVFSPETHSITLPPQTAYLWAKTDVLDLNYHLYNRNQDSVLAVDLYLNVYTQPKGTAQSIMYTRYFANLSISIPQDSTKDYLFTSEAFDTTETNSWNVWMLYSHTHKYGRDYNIYLRNPDGTKNTKIYDGFYNFDYSFNQGYYQWGPEAAERTIYPFLQVDPRDGFVHEATFRNTAGPNPVGWGLTSKDEMMVMIMQYTYGSPLGIVEKHESVLFDLKTSPNPFINEMQISYDLKKTSFVKMEVYNARGEKVSTLADENQENGFHVCAFRTSPNGFSGGVYLLRLTVDGRSVTRRLIETSH
jgi:mono/diheme cytochrome c family protein